MSTISFAEADMDKFVVKFREPRETETSDAWWPEGETRECNEQDAWIRCGFLFELALKGVPIEGAFIEYIRIHAAENEDKIVLIADPEEGGIFLGPWAEQCGSTAELRAKVEAEGRVRRKVEPAIGADVVVSASVVDTHVPAFTSWLPTPVMMN
jgi:hypothetical protein